MRAVQGRMLGLAVIVMALGASVVFSEQVRLGVQIAKGQTGLTPLPVSQTRLAATAEAKALVDAAEAQVGVVTLYDPSYMRLSFPMGDVAPDRGVCTDVLIRALRDSAGVDLQQALNRDMKRHFSAYPALWGLSKPDPNIDHRRVPNLRHLLRRVGAEVAMPTAAEGYQPGDIVTSDLGGGLVHVMIVSDRMNDAGTRPMIVHNIGAGTQVEDRLFDFTITGVYRLTPASLAALKAR